MRSAAIARIAGLMVLAMPTAAGAETIKHEGSIEGLPAAKVKFAVKKNDRRLQKVVNLRFDRVPVTCEDGTSGAITAQLPNFSLRGKEKFTRQGPIQGVGISDGVLRAFGTLESNGKKAQGNVRIAFKSSSGSGCGTSVLNWSTKKR